MAIHTNIVGEMQYTKTSILGTFICVCMYVCMYKYNVQYCMHVYKYNRYMKCIWWVSGLVGGRSVDQRHTHSKTQSMNFFQ